MNNLIDLVFGYHARQQGRVANITDDEFGSGRNGGFQPSGKVVQDDNGLTRVSQFQNCLAANVAGATGDQNGHSLLSIACWMRPTGWKLMTNMMSEKTSLQDAVAAVVLP